MMDMLKTFWPFAFKVKEKDVPSFVIALIIFVLICGIIGALIGVLAGIPIIGLIFKIVGVVLEAYGAVGIVLSILAFIGKLK